MCTTEERKSLGSEILNELRAIRALLEVQAHMVPALSPVIGGPLLRYDLPADLVSDPLVSVTASPASGG
jgi:hypothetical protein